MATKPEKINKSENKNNGLKYQSVLIRPRVTEKSALLAEKGMYTFEISGGVNKKDIASGIKEVYSVTPIKIRTAKGTQKETKRKGIKGVRRGNRKAMVYLKKGDKIGFM